MPSTDGEFAPALPAVSAAGDRAAIARGKAVKVYELPGGALLRTISHGAPVTAVVFAGLGRDLVSGATDGSVLVTPDGQILQRFGPERPRPAQPVDPETPA